MKCYKDSQTLSRIPNYTLTLLPPHFWASPKACIGTKLRVACGSSHLHSHFPLEPKHQEEMELGMVMRKDCYMGDYFTNEADAALLYMQP